MTRTPVPFALALALLPAAAGTARAQSGPALNAFFSNTTKTGGEGLGNSGYAVKLPRGRGEFVAPPVAAHLGPGRYRLTLGSGAPLPGRRGRAGWFVAVTALGGNGHCFEIATAARGPDLVSDVGCADPHGAPADAFFEWSYRSDSLEHRQDTPEKANFGYASWSASGKLEGGFTVAPGGVGARKLGPGKVRVTFPGLSYGPGRLEARVPVDDVQVSLVCGGGGACATHVCAPTDWRAGAGGTTVDVSCVDPAGAPRDDAFRLFIGQEALNSQASKGGVKYYAFNEGINYAWVKSLDLASAPSPNPIAGAPIAFRNRAKDAPGDRPIAYYHTARGRYRVTLPDQIIYGPTYWVMHVTTLETTGAYCNVGDFDSEHDSIDVACYDGTGAPRDGRWLLSMRRQYN